MLVIEIAVGVFIGGLGLWMLVLHRERKRQAKADEEQVIQALDAADYYVRERFESITAAYHGDIRRKLFAILDDPRSSIVAAFTAELRTNLASEHFVRFKTQVESEAPSALKEAFSNAARLGASERLRQHIDQLTSSASKALEHESGLLLCNELASINDDDLPSVTKGHARKQFNLGNAHRLGEHMEQDYTKALRLLHMSAAQGYLPAYSVLGDMYFHGEGVTQDYDEALKWLLPAAKGGIDYAQNLLGLMYSEGNGVERNYEEAIRWLRGAAEAGFTPAQCNLGARYFGGEGVEQNYVYAAMWFIRAASKYDKDALNNLKIAYKTMTPNQITEAEGWALYFDKSVLRFLLRLSEGLLPDPRFIYSDPARLAGYFTENYLKPLTTVYRDCTVPFPSLAAEGWKDDLELICCTEECVLWAAAGVVATVRKSKAADFHSTFVYDLADRVSVLLSWQDKTGMSILIKHFLESFTDLLKISGTAELIGTYRKLHPFWKADSSTVFADNLFDRALPLSLETKEASAEFLVACMSEETSLGTSDKEMLT